MSDESPVQRVLDRHVKWRLKALGIMDRVLADHPGARDEMKEFVETSRTRMIEARNIDFQSDAAGEQLKGCKSPYCEPPWCKNCGTDAGAKRE